jgi:hypothetical protein
VELSIITIDDYILDVRPLLMINSARDRLLDCHGRKKQKKGDRFIFCMMIKNDRRSDCHCVADSALECYCTKILPDFHSGKD